MLQRRLTKFLLCTALLLAAAAPSFAIELTDEEPRSTTEAVQLPEGYAEGRRWIIPTQRARELVGYLLSLDQKHALEEVQ